MNMPREFVSPSKEWAHGMLRQTNCKILEVQERDIRRILDSEKNYPTMNKHDILELKRKKIIIQARLKILADDNFNRLKELMNNVN